MSGKRIAIGIIVALVVVSGLAALALRSQAKPGGADPTAKVMRGDLAVVLAETGTIQPLTKVEVKSKVAGQVARLFVEAGQRVIKGQPLIQIDTIEMVRDLDQMTADRDTVAAQLARLVAGARPQELAQARAQLAKAEATYHRAHLERLRSEGAVRAETITATDAEGARGAEAEDLALLQDARAKWSLIRAGSRKEDLAEARARLAKATAALNNSRDQLAFATIRAPMAGTVLRRVIEIGDMVSPGVSATAQGTSMLTIGDLDHLIVATNLNQIDVGKVQLGQQVAVRVDSAPGRVFAGTIHKIAPAAEKKDGDSANIQTFPIETLLDAAALRGQDTKGALRPGMSADLDLHVARNASALYLPVEAVVRGKGNEGTVQLQGPPARSQAVTIGLTNDHQVEILTGVTVDQVVLIKPPSAADNTMKL